MKTILFFSLTLFVLFFAACDQDSILSEGTFPDTPINMRSINSEYDDYNSTAPFFGSTFPICFSSNRNTSGGTFDIIYVLLDIYMDKRTRELSVAQNTRGNLDVYTMNSNLLGAVAVINTSSDELGPYLIPQVYANFIQRYLLLYASNDRGNFDIRFTHNLGGAYSVPQEVLYLNSSKDDLYPTLMGDSTQLYFCSNREKTFDIYKANLPKASNLRESLTIKEYPLIEKDTVLSSIYEDKCPFIYRNVMVFASNRAGGFGGFDLYYSVYKNGKWSTPVNFGGKINTAFDEYRPIVLEDRRGNFEFTNDFMIFSSNREGGKGGYDLYHVGINKTL